MKRHSAFYTTGILAILSGIITAVFAIWAVFNMVGIYQDYPHISNAANKMFWISIGVTVLFLGITLCLVKRMNQYNKRWFNGSEFIGNRHHK